MAAALDAPGSCLGGLAAGSDAQIDDPAVTPWANGLIPQESDLAADARKLILAMARHLATQDVAPG